MQTPVMFGSTSSIVGTTTQYLSPGISGYAGAETNEALVTGVIPCDGTISDFFVALQTAPGAGTTRNFTIRINGANSSVVVVISDTATSGSDLVNSVSVSAGDTITIGSTNPTGSPATTNYTHFGFVFEAAANTSPVFSHWAEAPSTSVTEYACFQGGQSGLTTEASVAQVCPAPGTIKDLYVEVNTAPGSGKSWTVTLYKNGVSTGLTATVSDTGRTANDTSNTVTVAAGDLLSWELTPSGTPSSTRVAMSAVFSPDTDGESVVMNGDDNTLSSLNTAYIGTVGFGAYNVTETVRQEVAPIDFTAKNLYVDQAAACGSGASRVWTLRDDGADTALAATMSGDTDTTASDTSSEVSVAAGSLVNMKIVPTSSPAAVAATSGFVAYIDPGGWVPKVIMVL